ncbi:12037_t:CDS:2 [Funneliformis geosporum]|nr:12037_t:CDS:2 [Funneliformis geosporum]
MMIGDENLIATFITFSDALKMQMEKLLSVKNGRHPLGCRTISKIVNTLKGTGS